MLNSFCGTPLNMAPEILEKKGYTQKADIWSLGVLLFELISGVTPFQGFSKSELKQKIKEGHFQVPKSYHIPFTCLDFLVNCL